jgi:putative transposase
MPGRNLIKEYGADQYYHIYSRGVNKQLVFEDKQDYAYFLGLLKRYLSDTPAQNSAHMAYPWYGERLELLAYCLMPNHFHLLIYQSDAMAMTEFMRSLITSYGMYFNKRHGRVGPVFQSRYLASNIDSDNYLEHISRYIHLNPKNWVTYEYSSLAYYQGKSAAWVKPDKIIAIFNDDPLEYRKFLEDYESHKQILDELKFELAHE